MVDYKVPDGRLKVGLLGIHIDPHTQSLGQLDRMYNKMFGN